MAIQRSNLDDQSFAELVDRGIRTIPRFAPRDWTNHNPSDPGVTLIELLAYFTEAMLFRLNRITDANKRQFLQLLTGGVTPDPDLGGERLDDEIRGAVRQARSSLARVVTPGDFERVALTTAVASDPEVRVARAVCLPGRNIDAARATGDRSFQRGCVSVVALPAAGANWRVEAWRVEACLETVREELEQRRLVCTRLCVAAPRFVRASLHISVELSRTGSRPAVRRAIETFCNPLAGWHEGRGWPFGRTLFVSELYEQIDRTPGVEAVTSIRLDRVQPAERILRREGQVVGLALEEDELLDIDITAAEEAVPYGADDSSLAGRRR